jgi:hypothetical protein
MHTMTQELKHRRRWEVIAKKMDIRGFYLDPVFMTSSEGGGIMIVIMGWPIISSTRRIRMDT